MLFRKITLLFLVITTTVLTLGAPWASDTDTETNLIYIDPVTGKYTTTAPPDKEAVESAIPDLRTVSPVTATRLGLALIMVVVLLMLGHFIAIILSKRNT